MTMPEFSNGQICVGKPEGIVIWHVGARKLFKKTLDGDGHKGAKK